MILKNEKIRLIFLVVSFFVSPWLLAQSIPEFEKPSLDSRGVTSGLVEEDCRILSGKVDHQGVAYLPHFRIYKETLLQAEVYGENGELIVGLLKWEEGQWREVFGKDLFQSHRFASKVGPGYYCWRITAQTPDLTFELCEVRPIDAVLTDFVGPDSDAADRAYMELFNMGVDALPYLMDLAYASGNYSGGAYCHPNASFNFGMTQPPVALIALFLIDGIVADYPTPHLEYEVFSANPDEPLLDRLEKARELYEVWWSKVGGLSIEDIRDKEHPLKDSGLIWNGPVIPVDVDVNVVLGEEQNGKPVDGSSTPRKKPARCLSNPDGPDAGNGGDPYAWKFEPKDPNGPTPYNCMAWALNCQTDRWLEPVPGNGSSWSDILKDYGYDVDNPTTADAACPEGKGPKIKLVFFEVDIGTDRIQRLVHLMKQEDDGEWGSKNGEGPRYEDIKDCSKFLDDHYPTPKGARRVVKYYCKK